VAANGGPSATSMARTISIFIALERRIHPLAIIVF
jgi:hypothetical protein